VPVGRSPDAVARLGEVDELEVQPERPDDAFERLGVHRQDVERDPLPCPALARGDRALSRRLDELEDLDARLLHDDLAEQRAEEPHLPAQHVAGPGGPDAPGLRPFRMPARRRHGGSVIVQPTGAAEVAFEALPCSPPLERLITLIAPLPSR